MALLLFSAQGLCPAQNQTLSSLKQFAIYDAQARQHDLFFTQYVTTSNPSLRPAMATGLTR